MKYKNGSVGNAFDRALLPDYFFDDFTSLTPEWLKEHGIRGIVSDIDNTLVTYEDPVPTDGAMKFFTMLAENGIKISFVSNNSDPARVLRFNESLGYFATHKSGKPFGGAVRRAMKQMGTDKTNTMMLGDQIFTDIWAGKGQGLLSVLVLPIRDKTSLFFRTKRKLEAPLIRRYRRLHKKD